MPGNNKFRMYQYLQKHKSEIMSDIAAKSDEVKVPKDQYGKIGMGGGSGTPPTIADNILEAMHKASKEVVSLVTYIDRVRDMVKDFYGDDYDATVMSTAEAALWVSFEALVTPPTLGRGSSYRAAYIAPYERHLHHQGGYGRPFPPKYKELFSDRGVTSGELGLSGKRLSNLDSLIVPLEGARYPAHGIKYHPVPILTEVDPDASAERMRTVAERHIDRLAAFTSLGYDTIGYGYNIKDKDGTPMLQKLIGELAMKYDVPYICDNARGTPFLGTDPRKNNADVMMYSMDKAAGGPTCGLILGKEDVMVPVRKAMGVHGAREGTSSSFGKAAYVMADPGKEALAAVVVALENIIERGDVMEENVKQMHKTVKEVTSESNLMKQDGWRITPTINGMAVEINYADTWKGSDWGMPIFSIEDMYAASNLIQRGTPQLGIRPPLCYDGNLFLVMGQANLDSEGRLLPDVVELCVRGLVATLETIAEWASKMEK